MEKTPLFFAKEDRLLGVIAVADVIKEESARAVKRTAEHGNPGSHADRGQ